MTDQISRDVLPIPDRPYEGELPLDAKDPDASFPAVEPLRPDRKSTRLNSSHVRTSYSVFCLEFRRVLFRSDRKSTRLNSSHVRISYAVFCLEIYTLSLHDALPIFFRSRTGRTRASCLLMRRTRTRRSRQ